MKTLLAFAAVLLLAACGTETSSEPTPESAAVAAPVERPDGIPVPDGEVTTAYPVTVLDDGSGPELCLGGTLDSYPPQCGGPPLAGWDWSAHAGDFETANDVRWGEFVVTGAFDGETFTPSEVVPGDEWEGEYEGDIPDFSTPCDEPGGGWVVDDSLAGQADQDRAFRTANRLPDYSSSYIDGDLGVVNVRVTGDPAAAEEAIREVWGGGLCVRGATSTDAERARIQRQVNELPGMLFSGRGTDQVEVGVVFDDGTIQAWVDQEYGDGTVAVGSALEEVA